ncbi:MAG: hypothetical protein EZS28_034421 [Streblomastix strix]|uniref:Uncharacterized protein n=1 Tax=Streblomastix strix TaxID=222440 RepID=A0A5J4UJ10_9EUKA|nr:MAG: hypothetical protein EZS28_034421 [Streblomastix strix]
MNGVERMNIQEVEIRYSPMWDCIGNPQIFLLQVLPNTVELIDPSTVGIDNKNKTLALGAAHGAYIQVTTSEVRIIPTLRFSMHITNRAQQSQQQQQQNSPTNINQQTLHKNKQESKDEKSWQVQSEYIGYDVSHGIAWLAPKLLSEEQCRQKISNFNQNQSSHNSEFQSSSQGIQSESSSKGIQGELTQRVKFDCACITDNLIAVSYKCVVFVLIWNPSIIQYTSNVTGQISLTENHPQIQQIPSIVHPVATLCFPSPVKTLAASTICTRSFLVVGCESPPTVFLFRLDTLQIENETEETRKKMWDEGEQLLNNMKYQIIYPTVQRPNPTLIIHNGMKSKSNFDIENKHQIQIGDGNQCAILNSRLKLNFAEQLKENGQYINQLRFVEVLSGSHQYVEVQYSTNASMTRLLDLFLFDIPEQVLLTTFNRQVRYKTSNEYDTNQSNSHIDYETSQQLGKQRTQLVTEEYIPQ